MKKCIITILVVLLVTAGIQILLDRRNYSVGKDTVVQVGTGRFDIGKVPDSYTVLDQKTGDEIEPSVKKYRFASLSGKLYLIGSKGYTLIDCKGGAVEQHEALDQFDKAEQRGFRQPKIFISPKWAAAVEILLWVLYAAFVSALVFGGRYFINRRRQTNKANTNTI